MDVLPGIDVLLTQQKGIIAGQHVGLISNVHAATKDLTGTLEAFLREPQLQLVAVYGPEHGFYSTAPDLIPIDSVRDLRTGLPFYSLYGEVLKPSPEMLRGVDVLVFDLQTVGVRFYTYTTTLLYAMQAAAEHGIPILVCDRPNPLGGEIIEGPLLGSGFESFIGPAPLPIRYAMTIGELARFFNTFCEISCDLTIIPCQGWKRSMGFDDTGLTWVPPSSGLPKVESAVVYPGTCLIEGTNLSEGRGTALPFEVIGAPWVDNWSLVETLNALELPGIQFRPTWFEPLVSKWKGQICSGVQLHVRDRSIFRPVTVCLHILAAIKAMFTDEFAWKLPHFDYLAGTDTVRQQIDSGVRVPEITADWSQDQKEYEAQRCQVLLY